MPFATIPGQGFITCPEGFSTECCEPVVCPPGCITAPLGDPLSGTGGCPVGCKPEPVLTACSQIVFASLPSTVMVSFNATINTRDIHCSFTGGPQTFPGVPIPFSFSLPFTQSGVGSPNFISPGPVGGGTIIFGPQSGIPCACNLALQTVQNGTFQVTLLSSSAVTCGGLSGSSQGIPCGPVSAIGPVWRAIFNFRAQFISGCSTNQQFSVSSRKSLTPLPMGSYTPHAWTSVLGGTVCPAPCPAPPFCPGGASYSSVSVS